MIQTGKLIILSGPSGAGKSTVVSLAMAGREDICFSVSVTTRDPRPGEEDGKDYFFIDEKRFLDMARNGELLEHAQYVSNRYGTPKAYVEKKLAEGMNVVLDIEIQGARQVYEKMPDAISVFILPPSMAELRRRLEMRGTETPESLDARILRAKQEIAEADFYRYMIINDNAETAAKELSAIITAEHCHFDSELAGKYLL